MHNGRLGWWAAALAACGIEPRIDGAGAQVPPVAAAALAEGRSARLVVRTGPGWRDALPDGAEVVARYRTFPVVVVDVPDRVAADALAARPGVEALSDVLRYAPAWATSSVVVGRPLTPAAYGGAGTAVAVLDSGVDWLHPDVGGCLGAGCRVVYAADVAPDDGARDDSGHGTNVAAIVAGMAPDAELLALDVFDGDTADTVDVLAALDWVLANADGYGIAAVSLGVATGSWAGCDDAFAAPIAAARAAGIAVVVPTGNDGTPDAVGSPACNVDAIAVGAVYSGDAGPVVTAACADPTTAVDQVACFSNASPSTDLLAPGAPITAGGSTQAGTSQAAAHVAGALAALRSVDPDASVDELVFHLQATGATVIDPRTDVAYPRLDLAAAAARCVRAVTGGSAMPVGPGGVTDLLDVVAFPGCGWSVGGAPDWVTVTPSSGVGGGPLTLTVAPNPGAFRSAELEVAGQVLSVSQAPAADAVSIAGGAVGTPTAAVTLTLTSFHATTMCVSNTATCTAWQPYATTLPWTLATGTGTRTVYVWFTNSPACVPVTDTIVVDTGKPTNGTASVAVSDGAATVSWTGFTDASTGVASYRVMQATGAVAPANCTTGTPAWSGAGSAVTLSGLTNGTAYAWRVCAVDGAGNVSTGATTTATVKGESVPPTGSVVLNGGAAFSASSAVTATLTASDASGVTEACLSNTSTCTTWFPMVATKAWTLATGTGAKTVYAWYKDPHGNVSTAATDAIVVDTTKPTNGTLTAVGAGSGSLALSWSGFTDANGVSSYVAVYGTTTPTSCAVGTVGYAGAATAATLSGLTDGTTYGVRVCAVDPAGNLSTGAVATAKVAPELDPPTGAVVAAGGAAWTKVRTLTLDLTATDASGVSRMCVSSTATCTAWKTFAPTTTLAATTGDGVKTVYVSFEDVWGTASAAVTDTVGVDSTAPKNGTATATAGAGAITFSWSGFSDLASGLASYTVVTQTGTSPASCAVGAVAYTGAATTTTVTGLAPGVKVYARVCATDLAGNGSTGAITSATPL